jgi:hypothetical protein
MRCRTERGRIRRPKFRFQTRANFPPLFKLRAFRPQAVFSLPIVCNVRFGRERERTNGRVCGAGCVAKQRLVADGDVLEAGCVAMKRVITKERVVVGDIAALLANGCRVRGNKASEREHRESVIDNIRNSFHAFPFIFLLGKLAERSSEKNFSVASA